MIKVLFIGDIIGSPGRDKVKDILPLITHEYAIDFVIANGENSAGGKGITPSIAQDFFAMGIHAITLGNHTWDRKDIEGVINEPRLLRPANYPPSAPGHGYGIFACKGYYVGVISLMGRVYMPHTDCPFRVVEKIVAEMRERTSIIVVDFHAEITSEKRAMGWHLDGKVSAVIGTHTHVPTADACVQPQGTAYITDAGMVGPVESVIGVDRDIALKRFLTAIPVPFTVPKTPVGFNGVVIAIDEKTGSAREITLLIR
jgi:hypothetical protein